MPTCNGEKYIKEQLESILNQLSPDDEVIISDDSSTDNTINIINSFNDARIKLFLNNKYNSSIFNLENALKYASGDYIFLSDQDDIWHEKKVETMLPYFGTHDLVVSDCMVIDASGNIIHNSFYDINNSKEGFIHNLIKNSYLGCAMAFNQKVLKYVLPFPKNIAMHDIWIGLNSEIIGKPVFLKEKLIMYRRHGQNLSLASEKSKNGFIFKIKYRMILLCNIIIRYMKKHQ